MASTQYNGGVELYTGSPFKPDYSHTLMPCPMAVKRAWFSANCTPMFQQRQIMTIKLNSVTGYGVVRLELPINEVAGYNYAYIDSKRETPYFAFVLGYQYINDGDKEAGTAVYELTILKDVLMSHVIETSTDDQGDSGFRQCSIIRHHSTELFNSPYGQETIGGTAVSVDMYQLKKPGFDTGACLAVVQYVESNSDDEVTGCGTAIAEVPSGCKLRGFISGDGSNIQYFIVNTVKKGSNIATIYTVPTALLSQMPTTGDGLEIDSSSTRKDVETFGVGDPEDHVIGTKNKKCQYYPYNFIRVYNDAGSFMDLKWEEWTTTTPVAGRALGVEGLPVPPVSVDCFPIGYLHEAEYIDGGVVLGHKFSTPCTHKVSLTNYPYGSWVNDSYAMAVGSGEVFDLNALQKGDWGGVWNSAKRMFASGGMSSEAALGAGMFTKVAGGAAMSASTAVVGGLAAGAAIAADAVVKASMAEMRSETLGGNPNSNSGSFANKHKYFTVSHMALNEEDMYTIDKYFTMYGYAQNGVVRKPNPHGRPYWCYIETAGLTYVPEKAPCNANELTIINNAFNHGITMWNNTVPASGIGVYAGDNGEDPIPSAGECADIYCKSQR